MKKNNAVTKLRKSPINYFSDLFIVSMVLMWIADNIYQSVIASIVTVSSIILSHKIGIACYNTSMWASIGANVAIPLSCGGAIWMVKNAVQHAISNAKGKRAHMDFPAIYPNGMNEEIELEKEMEVPND